MSLRTLAALVGLQGSWQDADGRAQTVSDDTLRTILGALGLPADDQAQIAKSTAMALAERGGARSFVSAEMGQMIALDGVEGRGSLRLEDGTSRDVAVIDGHIPGIDMAGYHDLEIAGRVIRLAIAPARCITIGDIAPGRRLWGPAVQIPALRGAGGKPYGDPYGNFATLAETARAFARAGADALAISPTHALFPADASRFSPYAPSSRQYLNVMLADPAAADGVVSEQPALIDWGAAIPRRLEQFRQLFDTMPEAMRTPFEAFQAKGGDDLARHAAFDAIHAHFFARFGARGWQDWPTAFHDPAGGAVATFVAEHRADCTFYAFLQWLAEDGLGKAQQAAIDGGMAIGLVVDLAVGMDPGGSHAWSRRSDLLTGLSIGAPPDPLGPDGQAWGITGFDSRALVKSGFDPFIATIRAGLAHAGGLRIDHAFGLRRLWVVPDGASAAEGAYLDMPFDDFMRIIAIESHRAQAIVIGEDLGTVPDGFRAAMDARALLGMRVLWFERDQDGGFVPPADWSADAVAMTGTHDLATVAGWWQGRDVDWTWALGRTTAAADEDADRAARAADRTRLWTALGADGPMPDADDPGPVIDAALAHVGRTPCALAIVPLEDLAGLVEQPNLPGTTDEHPNWRRRMPDTIETLLRDPLVANRIAILDTARRS